MSEPGNSSRNGTERAAFVARLQLILRHWPSADRLARTMGVSPSAFRKWLKGEAEPSRERLVALADAAGVSIAWLAKGEGPEPTFQPSAAMAPGHGALGSSATGLSLSSFLLLPKRLEAVAAGSAPPLPSPPADLVEYIAFKHQWLRNKLHVEPENLLLDIAVGESMTPTIHDGDLLLIDTADRTLRSYGVYVLEIEGERLVKRVQRKLDGTLVLISDNTMYQADYVPAEHARQVIVIGRVLWGAGPI